MLESKAKTREKMQVGDKCLGEVAYAVVLVSRRLADERLNASAVFTHLIKMLDSFSILATALGYVGLSLSRAKGTLWRFLLHQAQRQLGLAEAVNVYEEAPKTLTMVVASDWTTRLSSFLQEEPLTLEEKKDAKVKRLQHVFGCALARALPYCFFQWQHRLAASLACRVFFIFSLFFLFFPPFFSMCVTWRSCISRCVSIAYCTWFLLAPTNARCTLFSFLPFFFMCTFSFPWPPMCISRYGVLTPNV